MTAHVARATSFKHNKQFSQLEILDFKKSFAEFDKDGDGVIDSQDLDKIFQALGVRIEHRELEVGFVCVCV